MFKRAGKFVVGEVLGDVAARIVAALVVVPVSLVAAWFGVTWTTEEAFGVALLLAAAGWLVVKWRQWSREYRDALRAEEPSGPRAVE